jgi:mRNA interferase YafQ
MAYTIHYTRAFEKDVKRLSHSGRYQMAKLKNVIETLAAGGKLEARFKNHRLFHSWKEHFECHIEPDWLLIYKIEETAGNIYFARTGSHSELFG